MKRRYNTPIRILCAILFAIFSFVYIYTFQGELLALMQDYLSQGVTTSNTFVAALIITMLLSLLQWGINRMSRLHGRWEALSYIPSCALLALITDINDGTMLYSTSKWLWSIPLVVIVYIGVVMVNRMRREVKRDTLFSLLWPNFLSFSLLFVITAQISNHAPAPHMELAVWSYLHDSKYEDMLKVGKRSDDYNMELTALRNLAMLKTGTLGERMFHYPQPYGADGLLCNRHNKQSVAYGSKEFYSHLGVEPYGGESGHDFAYRLYRNNDSIMYRDYYLAALLLDKNLDTFVKEIAVELNSSVKLPKHYLEALLLYKEINPNALSSFVPDSVSAKCFSDYRLLQSEYADNPIAANNMAKRKFGNTYWYYFDY